MFDLYSSSRRVDAGSVQTEVADHGATDATPVPLIRGSVDHWMAGSAEYVPSELVYERIEDAPHRIPLGAADELNTLPLDWLGSH